MGLKLPGYLGVEVGRGECGLVMCESALERTETDEERF